MAFGTVKLDAITTSTKTVTVNNLADLTQSTANFTGTLQNGGSNVLVDSDIGSTVQAYDAALPASNTIVVDGDIGSTVQGYSAKLTAVAGLAVTDGNIIVGNGSTFVAESGATARTSLGAPGLADANTFTAQQTFGEIKEGVYTLATSGTIALDPANGSIQVSVLTGNPSFTDSLESGQSIVLHLEAGASHTVAWPTGTIWTSSGGNSQPTLTAKDVVVFWKISSTIYAAYVGSYA